MDPTAAVECLADVGAVVGESPIWDHRLGRIVWVDILGCAFHSTDPATGDTETTFLEQHTGAVGLYDDNGHILALRGSVVRLHKGTITGRTNVIPDKSLRFNDGKVDPVGRFFVGSMHYDEIPGRGQLYQRSRNGRFHVVLDDVTVSNGLAWSPCGRWLYYVDSATSAVDRFEYDLDTGRLTNRKRLLVIPPREGIPDGLTVDSDGLLWVALFGGGVVQRYSPAGSLTGEIRLPTPQVTSCTFGGAGLDELYITTATHGLPASRRMGGLAGGLFVTSPGCVGRPEPVVPWGDFPPSVNPSPIDSPE